MLVPLMMLPWLLGGVHAWALYALVLAVLIGLLIWLFEYRGESRPLSIIIVPLVLAVLLGILQLIPLGPTVLSALSPRAAIAWSGWASDGSSPSQLAETNFRQGLGVVGASTTATASVYPASTRRDLALLFLAVALFFLGGQLFSRAASQKLLWGVVAANGGVFAFFGIAQQLVWNGKLYGQIVLGEGGQPFAAFVNRNNAAGYLNLCLAAAIGFALSCFGTEAIRPSRESATPGHRPWRQFRDVRAAIVEAIGRLDGPKLSSVLAIILILAGILCAMSRGGWVSLAIASAGVFTVLAKARRLRYLAWGGLLVFVASLSLVNWVGQREAVTNRWETLQTEVVTLGNGRLSHWADGLRAGSDFWLTGSGLGTYRYAYRPYVQSAEGVWFFHAENQYVEAFLEGGLVGLALLLAAIGLLVLACRRLLQEPRNSASFTCGVVGAFALVSQAVQGGFDFGLYLPANMALFALMCGSVAGRAAGLEPISSSQDGYRIFRPLVLQHRPAVLPAVAALLICGSLVGHFELRKASAADRAVRASKIAISPHDATEVRTSRQIEHLRTAIDGRPHDAAAHLALSRMLIQRYRLQAFSDLRDQTDEQVADSRLWQATSPIACFSTKNVGVTRLGYAVPEIQLVLHSKDVVWRIFGANSMVSVSDDVICLGFVDGGVNPGASVVRVPVGG